MVLSDNTNECAVLGRPGDCIIAAGMVSYAGPFTPASQSCHFSSVSCDAQYSAETFSCFQCKANILIAEQALGFHKT